MSIIVNLNILFLIQSIEQKVCINSPSGARTACMHHTDASVNLHMIPSHAIVWNKPSNYDLASSREMLLEKHIYIYIYILLFTE